MLDITAASSGVTETPVDRVGGESRIWNQNVYDVEVLKCYGIKKPSGSMCLHFELKNTAGQFYNENCYFLSSKGKVDYPAKDRSGKLTGKVHLIPGFIICANIVATAFPDQFKTFISDPDNGNSLTERYKKFFETALGAMEPGTVDIYDFKTKKVIKTEVDYVMKAIVGRNLSVAITKNLVNKEEKNAEGKYNPVAETKETNEIVNAYSVDGFTATEMLAQQTEPENKKAWAEKNANKVNDKRKIKDAPAKTPSTADPFGAAEGQPTPSLF